MISKIDPKIVPEVPTLEWENKLWETGIQMIGGIDEAGRGALAGPVAAAVVILPPEGNLLLELEGVRDSKQMSASQRETWASCIQEVALAFGVGLVSSEEVDSLKIIPATQLAAQRALTRLTIQPEYLLNDYIFLPDSPLPQTSLVKGDRRSLSIAAASILAKTSRDKLMVELDEQYPGYRLGQHKGYATAAHREAISELGPSPIHRMTFAPMRQHVHTS
jgi:ribonuclease HII